MILHATGQTTGNTTLCEEAMEKARDDEGVIPLPDENDYVDGSWRVTEEDVEIVRTLYNNNQKDD